MLGRKELVALEVASDSRLEYGGLYQYLRLSAVLSVLRARDNLTCVRRGATEHV